MNFREKLKKSPAVGIVVAGGLMILTVIMIVVSRSSDAAGDIWYYDLKTAQRIAAPPTQNGEPVTLPSGGTGVVAYVFSCGPCNGESFVGYLEMPDPNPAPRDPEQPFNLAAEKFVAAPPKIAVKPVWHRGDSSQGAEIMAEPRRRCGETYRGCLP